MIRLVEALKYRCLQYVRQPIDNFHVLVGPNASGKTTFLDVISFLGRMISDGIDAAVGERTSNFDDLLFGRSGEGFELAIEADIPKDIRSKLPGGQSGIRYEIGIYIDRTSEVIQINMERVILLPKTVSHWHPKDRDQQINLLFPNIGIVPQTLSLGKSRTGFRVIVNKKPDGLDHFYNETHEKSGKGWMPSFRLGPRKSTLANLPEDETRFPASTWLKNLLKDQVQELVLNSRLIRQPSPPGQTRNFLPDGSNLPWVIDKLKTMNYDRFQDWKSHLQTVFPDIEDVDTIQNEFDKHRFLTIHYRGGLVVPSWAVSDGTLRLLALTLPAYLTDLQGIFLIEEPENGIHPRAVEALVQSLSSVYGSQVLMATHSPVILSVVNPKQVLCFAKDAEGATAVVRGDKHPALRDWRGEENFSVLYAAGVLG